MNNQQTAPSSVYNAKHDENILVVSRNAFPSIDTWHGLQPINYKQYAEMIEREKKFLPRSQMEVDPNYKQIIPFLVFEHENKYFLMQRQAKATEVRLQSKYTFGIGGHIRQEDIQGNDIPTWAQREFEEEVDYKGSYTIEPLGLLNDDTNEVGKVHIGFVFLLHGDSADITVKSELKSGTLLTLEECEHFYPNMESWAQIVFKFLRTR